MNIDIQKIPQKLQIRVESPTPQIDAELKTEVWTFEVRAKKDADAGNKTTFNLNILKGNLNASIGFPTVPGTVTPYSLTGTVGKSFSAWLS